MSQILVCQEAEPEGRFQDTKIKRQCPNHLSATYVPLSTDYIFLADPDKTVLVPVLTQILLSQSILNAGSYKSGTGFYTYTPVPRVRAFTC